MGDGQKGRFCGEGDVQPGVWVTYTHAFVRAKWDDSLKMCAFSLMQILPQKKKILNQY